jgi:hypothetical protein
MPKKQYLQIITNQSVKFIILYAYLLKMLQWQNFDDKLWLLFRLGKAIAKKTGMKEEKIA